MASSTKLKKIYKAIKQQTLQVASEIDQASHTNLGMQEETLTDTTLTHIQYQLRTNFYTRKFTHKQEGNITGADWLWCIGEKDSWITFAVQAKIANYKTDAVNYLHYRQGEQYAYLIRFCQKFGFIPKYTVFAKLDKNYDIFSRKLPELTSFPIDYWSFSSISPKYIKHLSKPKEKQISNVLQYSLPWAYAFFYQNNPSFSLAQSIAHNLERVYWKLDNEYRRLRKQKPRYNFERMSWENPFPTKLITKNIPPLVLHMMLYDKLPSNVPIANISILSTTSISNLLEYELKKIEGTRKWKVFPSTFEKYVTRLSTRDDYMYY